MPVIADSGAAELEPEAAELEPEAAAVLQAATRMLAGVALRSMDALRAGVTLPQFRLLAVLADLGPVSCGRAARALGLDRSTITRLADRLVAAGHVARGSDPGHRGVVLLELTRGGRGLVNTAVTWRQRELARIMSRLSPGDQAAVTSALSLLVEAAGDDYGLRAHSLVPF
jgi:DNA-binding MarR family transcriptional regulator